MRLLSTIVDDHHTKFKHIFRYLTVDSCTIDRLLLVIIKSTIESSYVDNVLLCTTVCVYLLMFKYKHGRISSNGSLCPVNTCDVDVLTNGQRSHSIDILSLTNTMQQSKKKNEVTWYEQTKAYTDISLEINNWFQSNNEHFCRSFMIFSVFADINHCFCWNNKRLYLIYSLISSDCCSCNEYWMPSVDQALECSLRLSTTISYSIRDDNRSFRLHSLFFIANNWSVFSFSFTFIISNEE
jgi:hypothetical protein